MVTCSPDDLNQLISKYVTAKYLYHSGEGESPLSDLEFDSLERHLISLNACAPSFFKQVGVAVKESRETVPLPEPMGSLEKMRSDDEIRKWLYQDLPKGNYLYLIMAKVDGLSVELVYDDGVLTAAYTRGDGVEGTLITRHLLLIPNVPNVVVSPPDIGEQISFSGKRVIIRGEIYMPEAAFEEFYAKKYKNSRNLVAGVTRRKRPTEELGHMRLAVYHVYNPALGKKDMLNMLEMHGFSVPMNCGAVLGELSQEFLTTTYDVFASNVEYRIDGLVIEVDSAERRQGIGFETNSLNPAYARAFKVDLDSNITSAIVDYVEWSISKDGYLIPIVVIHPVELGGVTIRNVAAHNAKNVVEKGLGPGAEISIIRSGDVIPKIVAVLKPVAPQLPETADVGPYEFGASGVDLILLGESDVQKLEQLVHFFTTMEVDFLSSGILKKFFDKGYQTPEQILAMTEQEMIDNIDGVKKASAAKFIKAIEKATSNVHLPTLMSATGAFGRGFGESRSETLVKHFKGDIFQLLTWTPDALKSEICMVEGFSDITADLFVYGLPVFKQRFDQLSPFITVEPFAEKPIRDVFLGAPFVFSGTRSDELASKIVSLGGKVGDSVSSKTKYLILKDKNFTSGKVEKARSLGVEILDLNELAVLLSSKI